MQKIIVRKEINPRILIYILAFLILIPVLSIKVVSMFYYSGYTASIDDAISQGEYDRAQDELNTLFIKYGFKKRSLELYCELLSRRGSAQSDTSDWCQLIRTGELIRSSFFRETTDLDLILGRAYFTLGPVYYPDSVSHLLKIDISDEDVSDRSREVQEMLFAMFTELGEYERAEESISNLILKFPGHASYYVSLARTRQSSGKSFQAQEALKTVIFNLPYNPESKIAAFMLLDILGEYQLDEQKEFIYIYMLEKSSNDLDFIKQYGIYLYTEKGKRYQARRMWYKALEKHKKDKELRKMLGRYR